MGREAYRDGASDAQQFASPTWDRYALDNSYAEGFDDHMKAHPMCPCGEEAQPDTDPPMCAGCFVNKGGGNDPETKKEEQCP